MENGWKKLPDPEPRETAREKVEGDVRTTDAIANALKLIVMALGMIPVEKLEQYLEFMEKERSNYVGIGYAFGNPHDLEWKTMFYDQSIEKLQALVQFRKAMNVLEESRKVMKEVKMSEKLAARLFGGQV